MILFAIAQLHSDSGACLRPTAIFRIVVTLRCTSMKQKKQAAEALRKAIIKRGHVPVLYRSDKLRVWPDWLKKRITPDDDWSAEPPLYRMNCVV